MTTARIISRTEGIDANLKKFNLDAILIPTEGQSRILRQVFAHSKQHPGYAPTPAALAGYPIVTGMHYDFRCITLAQNIFLVPLGFYPDNTLPVRTPGNPTLSKAPGVPFGLSFTGMAWTEHKLLGFAYAYEQATNHRLRRRAYEEAIPKTQLMDVIPLVE